ncbi:hypothetical protein nbrc107696_24040 [Gordonia spumicola]|uniref:Uncharacterized protein n=1 Tax=Gordonia spumicola TaxID=589161 RepID=A0A7I9V990_9ACTN|nr:hypothetical protein [Gordonia spumicola]GEE01958.1 hypothetical protein nbrc107696_24040 [Gordonia spumicola]
MRTNTIIDTGTADLDPAQTVWFQIDDATGFYVTVEEFLAVARSQLAAA